MACSSIQNFVRELQAYGAVRSTPNGLRVASQLLLGRKMRHIVDDLKSRFPNLNRLLTKPVYSVQNGNLVFDQDMIDVIDNELGFNTSPNTIFNFTSNIPISSVLVTPTWDKYLEYREKKIAKLNSELSSLSFNLNSILDPQERLEVTRRMANLSVQIENEKAIVDAIKNNPELAHLINFAETDFKAIEDTLNSTSDINELNRIESLLGFYDRIISLDDNIVIDFSQLRDGSGNLLPDAKTLYDSFLSRIASKSAELKSLVEVKKKELAMGFIGANHQFKKMFGNNQDVFDELVFYKNGLPDTALIDAWLMDAGNSIFQTNGLIPQIMQIELDKALGKAYKHVIALQEKLDNVVPRAEAQLSKFDGKVPGMGKVTWSIFMRHSESGLRQDAIISAYTQEYERSVERFKGMYKSKMRKIQDNISDPTLRAQFEADALMDLQADMGLISEGISLDMLPEVAGTYLPGAGTNVSRKAYKDRLVKILGKYTYDKMAKEAQKKAEFINALLADRKASLFAAYNVKSFKALPQDAQNDYNDYKDNLLDPDNMIDDYSIRIPRETVNGQSSGFYSELFREIEANKDMMDFYKVLAESQELMYSMLPPDKQNELGKLSLMSAKKGFWEIYSDGNMGFLGKLSAILRHMWEFILSQFTEQAFASTESYVDPMTGKRVYQVNDAFFHSNKNEINSIIDGELIKIFNAMGYSATSSRPMMYSFNMNILSDKKVMNVLANHLGTFPTKDALEKKLGYSLAVPRNLRQVLSDAVTHSVMAEQSIDIPKILKLQMYQVSAYNARNEVLPMLSMMREYYDDIRDKSGNLRHNAMKQIDSWFERNVLDNKYSRDGITDTSDISRYDRSNKRMTKAEQMRYDELDNLDILLSKELKNPNITDEDRVYLDNKIKSIKVQKRKMGRYFTFSSVADGLLRFIRMKNLGWNLSSNVTNFAEGQISNMVWAHRNVYYNVDQLTRANRIVSGSTVNTITNGRITLDSAVLVKRMMEKFDVQMDATNELQKASKESTIDKASNLGPWELTRRTEYMNQSPVLVSILLNTKVTGINGEVSNAWDILEQPSGKIKPEFRTKENIAMLEDFNSEEFYALKQKISKAIVDIHGDYSDNRGNRASEYIIGKAMMSLKRWMIRYAYSLFGAEQIDLETGKKTKGRLRSMTKGQLIVAGALAGAVLSPVGMALGASIGAGASLMTGISTTNGIFMDIVQTMKVIAANSLRIPGLLIGRNMFNAEADYGSNISDLDMNNMQANLFHMSMILYPLILGLALKALLKSYEDEEEEEKDHMIVMNLMNRSMQIANQGASWMNPVAMYKSGFTEVGVIKFLTDASKLGDDINTYLATGEKGTEAAVKARKLIAPSIIRDNYLGFEGQGKHDLHKIGWDKYITSDKQDINRDIKVIKETELEKIRGRMDNISDEDWEKLKKKYSAKMNKRKGETKAQHLERLKRTYNIDE